MNRVREFIAISRKGSREILFTMRGDIVFSMEYLLATALH